MLFQWRVDEAAALAEDLARRAPNDPRVMFFSGMVRLHQGRYAEARDLMREALQGSPAPAEMKGTVDMADAVAKMASDFQEARSEHFILRWIKGKDVVLADDALAVLEKSYANVGADLKYFPSTPVVVEVYPDADSFCTASTLEKKDIERSGAIGICHFSRIMITSPRALLRGYPWLDTLCHEYTHYVVARKSNNSVPIWLHEGIAKFEEERWRRPTGGEMDLLSQTILAQALESNQTIGFEQMHPSLAKLDYREAQTAFAEMNVLVGFILKTGGPNALPEILGAAAKGDSIQSAVSGAVKTDFKAFLAAWNDSMKKMPLKKIPGLQIIKPKLAKGAGNLGDDVGFDDCDNVDARNLALLGDMLKDDGLWDAAQIEYEKALKAAGVLSPQVMNKVAQALTSNEKLKEAESLLNSLAETYPDYSTTYANLGALFAAQRKYDRAAESLRRAVEINPFNPFVRQDLAEAYSRLGKKAEAERETSKLRILVGDVAKGENQSDGKRSDRR